MAGLKRILHVEDEPDIRNVAALTLEALGGYTVESCASGSEALKRFEEFAPDLILIDVMMPGMDGPTTLKELRKLPAAAAIPVIFMTAKVQSHELDEYISMGAVGVITKPFDPMTLCGQIEELWRGRPGPAS